MKNLGLAECFRQKNIEMSRLILKNVEAFGGPDSLPATWARMFETKMPTVKRPAESPIDETLPIAECFAPDLPEVAQ